MNFHNVEAQTLQILFNFVNLYRMFLISMKNPCLSGKCVQFVSALIAMIGVMCAGLHMGWSSPAIPKILAGESGFEISRSEASWIVSMLTFGATIGSILANFLVDRIGRKTTISLSAGPYFCAWLLIIFSASASYLFAAQLVAGLSLGVNLVVISMYLAEIAEKHLRGSLSSTVNFGLNVGMLLSYAIGPHLSYRETAYVCVAFPVVFFLTAVWLPESPYYHILQGSKEKAIVALSSVRNSDKKEAILEELDMIEDNIKRNQERKGNIKELLTNKIYRKGLLVALGLRSFQQLCGTMPVSAYLEMILEESHMDISARQATIFYGTVQVLSGIASTMLTDKLGRKVLLYVSFTGLSLSMTATGAYFFVQDYLKYPQEKLSSVSWIPLACILIFSMAYNVGVGALGYSMLSELFPTNVKSIGVCMAASYGAFLTFVVTKLYLVIADSVGSYVAFWIFAFFSYCGLFFTYFCVPETKNKTFQEIQDKLNKKKPPKSHFNFDNNVILVSVIPKC